jgi:hypothetical protein
MFKNMVMKFEFIVMWKEAIVGHLNKSPEDREAKEEKPLRDFRLSQQCSAQKT